MARPLKQGLQYFPLDVDMDQDDKIAMIEAFHGIEGFGVVIKLLSKIYKEGYFYEWTKREQVLFSKRINVDINSVLAVVNDCVNEGIFNKKLFEEHHVLTSKGIQSRYLEAAKRRKEVTFIKEYLLIPDVKSIIGKNKIDVFLQRLGENEVYVNINPDSDGDNVNKSTQRKEKDSIEKDIKQKQSETVIVNPFNFFENNFSTLNSFISDNIGTWIDDTSEEVVVEAMKIALANNAKNWSYINTILKTWYDNKIRTIEDVQAHKKEYEDKKKKRTGKTNIPDWDNV